MPQLDPPLSHSWDLNPSQAVALQRKLQAYVQIKPLDAPIRRIGGTDLSYDKRSDRFYAGIVVLNFDTLKIVAHSTVIRREPFPYIPGLLSFREIPSLMEAWKKLPLRPEIVMCDGHGIAHPRRMGIASHFGLLTQTPSIGCAKRILVGDYREPPKNRGAYETIRHGEETIGFALCTKDKIKPVFVSPGHLIDHEQSRELTLYCARGYKLPEPTRQAHLLVNRLRQGQIEAGTWAGEKND